MALLEGDADKELPFRLLVHWRAGHMSTPHTQPKDRVILGIKGVCWFGTGDKPNPDAMIALHSGQVLSYFAKGLHYDGARDGDCVMEVSGMGPIQGLPPLSPTP